MKPPSRAKIRVFTRPALALTAFLIATGLLLAPEKSHASSVMAVGQDEGFSGKVMDKIIAKWRPPPQLKREYRLTARIALDGQGNVLECKAQRSSGLEALDASACAAARAAAPFGSPPYGMPADVYLSFWTGGPQNALPPERDPLVVGRGSDMVAAQARAQATNERARAMAEEAARKTGKPLPGTKDLKKANVGETGKNIKAPVVKKETPAPKQRALATNRAQDKYGEQYEKYLSKVVWALRKAIFVPVEAKPGTYYVTARVECDPAGNIVNGEIIEGSGNSLVDRYALQGVYRAKKIEPPPEGLGTSLDLTIPIVRQKDRPKAAAPQKTAPASETGSAQNGAEPPKDGE